MKSNHHDALSVELRGIEPVPDTERHGSALDLLWVWFAANIGILAVVYGAVLVTDQRLDLWQVMLAAVVGGVLSFLLVGLLSIAGKWGGAPALTLSRASFGVRGNRGPTLISWISLVGWESAMSITAAYACLSLLNKVFGVSTTSDVWIIVSLAAVVIIALTIGLLGYDTIIWIQKWCTYVFGAMTVIVIVMLAAKADWHRVTSMPSAPTGVVIAGIGFIAAGAGISWLNTGPDYARYLPRPVKGRSIAGWVTLGASVPLIILVALGGLMAAGNQGLANAADPVSAIGVALPGWMAVPYLLTAIAGLMASTMLGLYSSGLNLLALGLRVKRPAAVSIDGILITAVGIYVMVIAQNFYGPLTTFLTLLAVPLCAWAAVFGVNMLRNRGYDVPALTRLDHSSPYWFTGGISVPAVTAWLIAILAGLAFTTAEVSPTDKWFSGPLASTWVGTNGLGWAVALVVAGVIYAVTARFAGGTTVLRQRREDVSTARDAVPAAAGAGTSVAESDPEAGELKGSIA